MTEKIRRLLKQYSDALPYLFFGVCTTIINVITYALCANVFHLSTIVSTITAWILSVIFAFITDKLWVFHSKSWQKSVVLREIISFFGARLATLFLDVLIMWVAIDLTGHQDDAVWSLFWKLFSNAIIIILNYFLSKFLIFKSPDSFQNHPKSKQIHIKSSQNRSELSQSHPKSP